MAGPGTKRTDSPGALHQTPPNQPREGSSRRPVLGTTLRPAAILCPEPSSAGSAPKRPVTGRRASPGGCRRPRRSGDPILGAKKGGRRCQSYSADLAARRCRWHLLRLHITNALCNRRARARKHPGPTSNPSNGHRSKGSPSPSIATNLCPIRRLSPKRVAPPPFPCSCTNPGTLK